MKSLSPESVRRWTAELEHRGYEPAQLSAGIEGAVFRLGDGTVAKVWNTRTNDDIAGLATFYNSLAEVGLPFRTPRIIDVGNLTDATVSIEQELPGFPLFPAHTGESPPLEPDQLRAVVDVLRALASVAPTEELKRLPVLDEQAPLWTDGGFNTALAGLVTRRVQAAVDQLRVAIRDVDELAAIVAERLLSMPVGTDGLVHGDLVPANILMEYGGGVASVLDFGFLTTVGAPEFDSVVTANIFDMYGPNKGDSVATMGQLIEDSFGFPRDVLTVYLSAYALVTMNLFGTSERDGHFHWCAEVLRRPDVVATLFTD